MSDEQSPGEAPTETVPETSRPEASKQVFTRVCRKCSAQAATSDDRCPACGASYAGGLGSKAKKRLVIGFVAVVVLVIAAAGVSAKISADHDAEVKHDKAVAAAKAQKAAEAAAAEQESADAAERKVRQEMVPEIERAITKMARQDVNEGALDGPIYSTSCDPVAGGTVDDLTEQTTKFDCLAINKKNSDGSAEGYKFHATMNWDTGSYTYGLGEG